MVRHVVLTHNHSDHAGGLPDLEPTLTRATVHIGRADGGSLTSTLPLRLVDDGDEVFGLSVVATPGHTPGSICLWAPRHRLLFTGDVLQVRWGRLTYASAFFSHDYPAARAAVARLATLDVETIALAHYGLWRRDAHERLRALAAAAG